MAIRILLSRKLGELRWTQSDLVRATGICRNTINDYYNEVTDRVNLEYLDLICEALDCDLYEILQHSKNKIPKVTRNRNGTEKIIK